MNKRFIAGSIGVMAVVLAACGTERERTPGSDEVPDGFETVRLHFTTFSKSNSGAT